MRPVEDGQPKPNLEVARAALLDELGLSEVETLRTRIKCDCDGLPGVIGAMRSRARATHGHAQVYMPRAHVRAQETVAARYRQARGAIRGGFTGPVMLTVVSHRKMPRSWPRRRQGEPDTARPDGDNIAKLVADALTGAAWRDDSQVVSMLALKAPRVGDFDWLDIEVTYCERRGLL